MTLINIINTPSQLLGTNSFLVSPLFTNYGCKKGGENQQYQTFESSPMASATAPNENLSVTKYLKNISNQYNISSCVGNAVVDYVESLISIRDKIEPSQVSDLSRLFVYWAARNLEYPPAGSSDNGTKIWLAFDAATRYGIPKESTWQYTSENVNIRPSILAYREAIQHRIYGFYRLTSSGDKLVAQIKQCLNSGSAVVFGTRVGDEFRNVKPGQVLEGPPWFNGGGHALIITGYDFDKKAFIIRNSWGSSFGDNGYCLMSHGYITSIFSYDFYTATL